MWSRKAALSVVVGILLWGCGASDPAGVVVGSQAPGFRLEALDGSMFEDGALEGRPAVVNFWATWCQPCMREIPVLKDVEREGAARVIGIALDEEGAQKVAPFVDRMGIAYTILLGDQDVFQRFNGYTIPYTLVLDGSRTIVSVYRGPITREELERDLDGIGS